MSFVDECLAANRGWAFEMRARDPLFFERLRNQQRPQLLWIGCADSRLVPTHMIGRGPGEVFVHRNVGNLVWDRDPNCLAVLEHAIDTLGIRDVVVCGHYGCGGVRAALAGGTGGHVGAWLRPLRALSRAHAAELDALSDPAAREDRLCELNVAAQVANLTRSDVVRRAWARGLRVSLHGWIYSVADGHLHALDLGSVESLGRIMPAPLASAPVRLAR